MFNDVHIHVLMNKKVNYVNIINIIIKIRLIIIGIFF